MHIRPFKGTVAPDFEGPFLACMDRSGRETFYVTSVIFEGHFKVLKCLMPKHLRDSWNLPDGFTNVGSGSWRRGVPRDEFTI